MVYVETYGMILTIVIGFLAAGVFVEEFRVRADAVFFASRYGRTKAAGSKVLAGLLIATIIYWAGMGILLLISLGVMGISGGGTLYQIDFPYSIYVMTYGQYCTAPDGDASKPPVDAVLHACRSGRLYRKPAFGVCDHADRGEDAKRECGGLRSILLILRDAVYREGVV